MGAMFKEQEKLSLDQSIPMIAWIMPVYNGKKYIKQAIESILRQPCKDCEVWVVDDGSVDETAQIVKAIQDDRVHYIYQENAGVSAARNNGIRSSRSKYVAFLDADDVICKDAYDCEVHGILEDGKYETLSFSYVSGNQRLTRGYRVSLLNTDCCKHICSFVYHRALFAESNGLQFPEGIRVGEDAAFLFLVLHTCKSMYESERSWYVYRNNISSVQHQYSVSQYIDDIVPGWYWCKKQCKEDSARNECDARLFATVADYIRLSCMDGVPITTIQKNLAISPIQEALENHDALWQSSIKVYEAFMADPETYWNKKRKKGRLYSLARKAARMPGVRQVYLRMKYKDDIRQYIYD